MLALHLGRGRASGAHDSRSSVSLSSRYPCWASLSGHGVRVAKKTYALLCAGPSKTWLKVKDRAHVRAKDAIESGGSTAIGTPASTDRAGEGHDQPQFGARHVEI